MSHNSKKDSASALFLSSMELQQILPQDEFPDTTNLLRNRKDKDLGSQRSSKSNQTVLVTEPHNNDDEDEDDDDYDDRTTTFSDEVRSETLSPLLALTLGLLVIWQNHRNVFEHNFKA